MIIYTDRFPEYSQYQMLDNQTLSHSQSIFDLDQKNHFNFLDSIKSKIESFSLKTHKISEQQINPKVLSVANFAIIMKIPKMANIVYRQMPLGKRLEAKAPGWGQIFMQIPGVLGGGGGYGKN